MSEIIQNAVIVDGVIYRSTHVHDFIPLPDGRAIDGGHEYIRTTGVFEPHEDLMLCDGDFTTKVRHNLTWGTYGPTGADPLKWVLIRKMSLDHINNVLKMYEHTGKLKPVTLGVFQYWQRHKQEYEEALTWLREHGDTIADLIYIPYASGMEDREIVEEMREAMHYMNIALHGDCGEPTY